MLHFYICKCFIIINIGLVDNFELILYNYTTIVRLTTKSHKVYVVVLQCVENIFTHNHSLLTAGKQSKIHFF